MRVALVGHATSVHIRRWAQNIAGRGVEVVVFSPVEPNFDVEWVELPLRWSTIPWTGLGTWRAGRWFAEQCRSGGIDLVHAHYVSGLAHIAHSSGVYPLVVTPWGSDVLRQSEVKTRGVVRTRATLKAADLVMCGSRHLVTASIAAGARPEACRLVGWGVDTTKYAPSAEARARVRNGIGVDADAVVVMSTRVLEPLYRVECILEAFAMACAGRDDLVLVVIGAGPGRRELEALSASLGVADRVRFTGRVDSMPDTLAAADLVVSVPRSDGGPLSLIEAMAAGLPVVGTDLPSYREWIVPGETGELWAGNSVADLSGAILTVAGYPPERGARARAEVQKRAERSEQFDRAVALYSALATGEPLPPDPVGNE
jgi:glycosyltransferase involved in cell wall biosynthesis